MHPPEAGAGHGEETSFASAKRAALRSMAHRPRTEAQVSKLLEDHYSLQVVQRVIGELRQRGYLDDAAFARTWRQHRERHRPRGPGIIRQELLRFGVPTEVIQDALAGFDAENNAYRAGRGLALRLAGSEYRDFRRRLWPYLQRRGFTFPVIGDTINRLWQDLPDLLNGSKDPKGDEE